MNNKTEVISSLDVNGTKITEKNQIANEFASFFSSIGVEYVKKINQSPGFDLSYYLDKMSANNNSIFLHVVTNTEVENIIKNLKPKGSSGYDGISNKLLKEIYVPIIKPLCEIFNKSLTEECFPERMKSADVVPLHKNKSKFDKNNFRPISLLLTISKLLEKKTYKRVYDFLRNTT